MTDRVRSLTVILDRDMRDDDVECVVAAIEMVKCVQAVELGPVNDIDTYIARSVAVTEVRSALLEALEKCKP